MLIFEIHFPYRYLNYYSPQKLQKQFPDFTWVPSGKHGYLKKMISPKEKGKLIRICSFKGFSYKCYDKQYERSNNYRQTFFESFPKDHSFRCIYCNKKLSPQDVTVDHLIPIDKAKTSIITRFIIKKLHYQSINDIKNLVPACSCCNRAKSNKMGLWIIRGILGKYKIYWGLVYFIRILLFLFAFYLIYLLVSGNISIQDLSPIKLVAAFIQ